MTWKRKPKAHTAKVQRRRLKTRRQRAYACQGKREVPRGQRERRSPHPSYAQQMMTHSIRAFFGDKRARERQKKVA